jgi:hypothetical protein
MPLVVASSFVLFPASFFQLMIYSRDMKKLKDVNPYLKSASARKTGLRISAQTSSAVEGIRAPYRKKQNSFTPATTADLIAFWKRRVAANER